MAKQVSLMSKFDKELFKRSVLYNVKTLYRKTLEEGFVYEVISKIQTMRKDSDFEVMDHIKVAISGNEKIAEVVRKNESVIGEKVLADEFIFEDVLASKKEWNVNSENVTIGVERVTP